MQKIKPLMPSLREKKRYLAFKAICPKSIKFSHINNAVGSSFKNLYGITGEAEAGVILIKSRYDENSNTGIIRVNHNYLDKLRLSLAMIKEIDNTNVIIKSVSASGMIKKAQEKIAY